MCMCTFSIISYLGTGYWCIFLTVSFFSFPFFCCCWLMSVVIQTKRVFWIKWQLNEFIFIYICWVCKQKSKVFLLFFFFKRKFLSTFTSFFFFAGSMFYFSLSPCAMTYIYGRKLSFLDLCEEKFQFYFLLSFCCCCCCCSSIHFVHILLIKFIHDFFPEAITQKQKSLQKQEN